MDTLFASLKRYCTKNSNTFSMCCLKRVSGKMFVTEITTGVADIPKATPNLILGCTSICKLVHDVNRVGDGCKVLGYCFTNFMDEILVMLFIIAINKEMFSHYFWVLLCAPHSINVGLCMPMYNRNVNRNFRVFFKVSTLKLFQFCTTVILRKVMNTDTMVEWKIR